MAVIYQPLIVRGVTRFINGVYSTMSGIAMKLSGLLQVDSLKFGTTSLGDEDHPIYLADGVPTACDNLLMWKEYSYMETMPSGSGLMDEGTPSGAVFHLVVDKGLNLYTSSSSVGQNYLYAKFNGSYGCTLLNNENWYQYIEGVGSVNLNNGTVTFQYNGTAVASCTMNQSDDTTVEIPVEVPTYRVDNTFTSQFRTLTRGASGTGDYLSLFSNSGNHTYLPKNSPSVAWGRYDTHTYLTVSASEQRAFMGAGAGDSIVWGGELAFKTDLPTASNYMETNGNLNTTSSLKNLMVGVTASNTDTNRPYGMYNGMGYGYLDDDDKLVLRGTGGDWWLPPMTYVHDYIASKRLTYYTHQVRLTHDNNPMATKMSYVFNTDEIPVFIFTQDEYYTDDMVYNNRGFDLYLNEEDGRVVDSKLEIDKPFVLKFIDKKRTTGSWAYYFNMLNFYLYREDAFYGGMEGYQHLYTASGSFQSSSALSQVNTAYNNLSVGDYFMVTFTIQPRPNTNSENVITNTLTKL